MKGFNCPHCNEIILADQIPSSVGMASAGHTKSAAKTTAARLNARVRRKPATDNPVNPATPDQPVADGTVKLVADTSAPVVKALSVADTKAVADKLKPPATARDYSAVYSSS